ncbi:cellulose synthase complex periplasmic endoglucanase BcsZ [Halomonas organivorans]|uniref:cellulase n=1 Tax=Halomonas organivorans TaxID=257772 RepID=A0A7W5G5D5_9GAMM|nr:cellulose synthase complex periplasmic endoglucanase BcsZ [Halomonas organivorans]MBB3141019.1 endoglucanase [Halomonas organivorans]
MLRTLLLAMSMQLMALPLQAAEHDWPAWSRFEANLISEDGRVIDPSDERRITTSEGQSYALLFALVADDRDTFQRVLDWTQNNLAKGDLGATLPAWLWGRGDDDRWGVIDANSAADSDLWLAYTLLEAGRLWQRRDYRVLGQRLAGRIAEQEVAELPGFGKMLLPGRTGFVGDASWRVNPSYLPPQLLTRLSALGGPWPEVAKLVPKLLLGSAPRGLAPDWVAWRTDSGWQPDPEHGAAGDYDAIRVYLWLGMLAHDAPYRETLLAHFQPMRDLTASLGVPPEHIDARSGESTGIANVSFSAALLPFLVATAQDHDAPLAAAQRRRIAGAPPDDDAYYSQVLMLFGVGWDQGRYRFAPDGSLHPAWEAP